MSNAESLYKNSEGHELKLSLDIDLKSGLIKEFFYNGSLSSVYQRELEELKSLILNHTYTFALEFKRENLKQEVRLTNGKIPIASMSLWLIHKAIEDYLGTKSTIRSESDLLCLCFGISESELKKEVLNRSDYDLPAVIAETMATSACGSCRDLIIKKIQELREDHGLIQGKEGHWIKIKGMYPGELLIKLDELKKKWMKREGIEAQFQIEIKKIEGHHLWISVTPAEDIHRNEKMLKALSDFWHSEIGALFFLYLAT